MSPMIKLSIYTLERKWIIYSLQGTNHQPKFFIWQFIAQDPLYMMLKSLVPPGCQCQVLGWVWKSPEMWGICSPFSLSILWDFSFRLRKLCLECGPQQACAGAAQGRFRKGGGGNQILLCMGITWRPPLQSSDSVGLQVGWWGGENFHV